MSSKLATSVTAVADQPCRGVPPRLLHVPCCYVPAVIRSLKGGQEIRKTGGLSKHSLSARPGRQCDAPGTPTSTLRLPCPGCRALGAARCSARTPGPPCFPARCPQTALPRHASQHLSTESICWFVPTSLPRLLHRQLRLITRH